LEIHQDGVPEQLAIADGKLRKGWIALAAQSRKGAALVESQFPGGQMTPKPKLFSRRILVVLLAISVGGWDIRGAFAVGEKPAKKQDGEAPVHIELQDSQGLRVAATEIQTHLAKPVSAALSFDREYLPGDRIVISGPQRIAVRLDESMPECLLYLPGPSHDGSFSYEIPYGREERQTGSAYAPESFSGKYHRVAARAINPEELASHRNLALNPCDLPQPGDSAAQAFPHASTNSYARSLYDFAARNAIDGNAHNGHHGVWPYESWGPELRQDLWWKLDFGRSVKLDKIRLMIRADFPHDSYWKSATVEFSDGSKIPIEIGPSAEFQEFAFPKRKVSWLRIADLVPSDPARWCSFIEVEAWGRDLP
jgi:hypothetical protein